MSTLAHAVWACRRQTFETALGVGSSSLIDWSCCQIEPWYWNAGACWRRTPIEKAQTNESQLSEPVGMHLSLRACLQNSWKTNAPTMNHTLNEIRPLRWSQSSGWTIELHPPCVFCRAGGRVKNSSGAVMISSLSPKWHTGERSPQFHERVPFDMRMIITEINQNKYRAVYRADNTIYIGNKRSRCWTVLESPSLVPDQPIRQHANDSLHTDRGESNDLSTSTSLISSE